MKKESRFYIALLLIFTCTLQLVGCTRAKPPVNIAYDGETLYRGLFFRNGPAAHQASDLWKLLGQQPVPPSDKAVETLRQSADRQQEAGDPAAAAAFRKIADSVSRGTLPLRSPTGPASPATIDATIAAIRVADSTFFSRFAQGIQSGDPVKVDRAMTEAGKLSLQVLSDHINSNPAAALDVWYEFDIAVAIEVAAVVLIALLAVFPFERVQNDLVHDDAVKIITERFYAPTPLRR
jgi:SdpC family antimicrobial peptide